MASDERVFCGPCMYEDVTKDAKRWCSNCKEGLCEDCETVHRKSKISRKHKVILIEDYRKIANISILQVCEHHGENLEWFCKTHDEVLCMVCVPSEHKACSDVVPINVASINARQSTALFDLEEAIDGTLHNVKQCIMNRESATKEIEKQELAIKTTIRETRTKINGHLDSLQEKLLYELKSTSRTCKSKHTKFLQKLKSTEEMLTKLREQTFYMKQFSSDIEVFLGTRQGNQRIVSEVESIKSEISATKDYELKVAIHSLIEKISIEAKDFGQIKVSESTANRKYEIDISGCVILPNGHLLIANNTHEKQLVLYSDTGEHIRDIPVCARPFDITVIDSNRIIVTYTDTKFIEIIDSNSFNVEKRIKLKNSCFGISIEDGRLYLTRGNAIHILDLSGTQLDTLKVKSDSALYITTSRDRIFYTDCTNNSVHCCSLLGEDVWQFTNELLACPYDVAVDMYNNVYVVGYNSNNLTIIQQDGKDSRTLLTDSNGLDSPSAVYYSKEKRTLLICNENGKVALYKTRYKVV
ncbi:unnamed protein product [Mytilus edulis]|uniref:B box-type domain-containing protein n=1 Tax=Mytilus edulis TaxID=6550 RepID=A0A8S3S632_MYTED|nr:unnamed protein product [Mytilus edulis]